MPYHVVLSSEAQDDLRKLDAELQVAVVEQLRDLCQNPATKSRPSCFPHLPNGQISTFPYTDFEGQRHHFSIRFFYSQDEKFIKVACIGHALLADDF
jgi:hypothetical protein